MGAHLILPGKSSYLTYIGEGILQTERTMPLASLVIPDQFFYFYLAGGREGRCGEALNSTRVEFIPRLYRGRYPADRRDTAIGQSRHS